MKKMLRTLLRPFRKGVDIEQSWVETPVKFDDMVKFLSWFDKTSSVQETIDRACSDWKNKITAFQYYSDVPKGTCLEIGFGAGRLLVEAGKDFQQTIGVDIHDAFEKAREYISLAGGASPILLHKDQLITLEEASIDFIFSFIVFQHFDTETEVDFYLDQIKRIMNPKGCAHIFYRKHESVGVKVVDPKDFRKRHSSLFFNAAVFREKINEKFKILEFQDHIKKHIEQPESSKNISGQARVVFTHKD